MEYVIFPSLDYPVMENCSSTNLTHKEVNEIELIIEKELSEILEFHKIRLIDSYDNLENEQFKKSLIFVRQYSAYLNNKNDKLVLIRFMCDSNSKYETYKNNWKTEPLGNIIDGGSCYFDITVDYTNKRVIKSSINTVVELIDNKIELYKKC